MLALGVTLELVLGEDGILCEYVTFTTGTVFGILPSTAKELSKFSRFYKSRRFGFGVE